MQTWMRTRTGTQGGMLINQERINQDGVKGLLGGQADDRRTTGRTTGR